MWKKLKPYVLSIGIALAVGGLSALATGDSMKKYTALRQPPLAPPGGVFPIVWTILFVLMGIGAALVWRSEGPDYRKALRIYGTQLLVNFFWTILFFLLEARLFAFLWLLMLLGLVIAMAVQFGKYNKAAGLLQLPYILWLIFAGYLNLGVYLFNG